ncbi:hypothetical protein C3F09_08280 [candidate division GN15 bacterium]|uniref:Methyltransferase domain-containing protein n=1 Tax=candidate division GN15 bacterium TaxID=2072418 RepID=A0A855X1K7_9BACT|nr:MAG: hypothetical protein C3F09_08280 [candidate division GN15 bacterium]
MARIAGTRKTPYNPAAAGRFWSQRLQSTDPLSAVLSYGAPKELNRLYDQWEREALARVLPTSLRRKRALDIGAGIGRISILLAKMGADVTSVDISHEMLRRLTRRARTANVGRRITVVQESSHEIPLSNTSCDIVTCLGLLEHLPDDVRAATIKEAARLVKRSGRIYVVVNNIDNPFLSRNYPLKRQRPDGYFVSLVGLDWLRSICRKCGLVLTVRAANPWYGLVHYHLYPYLKELVLSPQEFKQICSLALRLDTEDVLPPHARRLFASHFLVELRPRPRRTHPAR